MNNINLGENIIKIRKEKGITQKELAQMTNMTPQALLKIEKGVTSPKDETLDKIMKALDATEEDLFGEKDFYKMNFQLPFARNLQKAMVEVEIAAPELAKELGINVSKVYDMENGRIIPNNSMLKQICQILNTDEERLMSNDMHTVNLKEVDLMNLIKTKNYTIDNIQKILEWAEPIEGYNHDEKTGDVIETVITSYDQAKHELISIFKALTVNELIEVYDSWMTNKITKYINNMDI